MTTKQVSNTCPKKDDDEGYTFRNRSFSVCVRLQSPEIFFETSFEVQCVMPNVNTALKNVETGNCLMSCIFFSQMFLKSSAYAELAFPQNAVG